jgi:hypothetical protein
VVVLVVHLEILLPTVAVLGHTQGHMVVAAVAVMGWVVGLAAEVAERLELYGLA